MGYWNYNTSGGEGGSMEWIESGSTHNTGPTDFGNVPTVQAGSTYDSSTGWQAPTVAPNTPNYGAIPDMQAGSTYTSEGGYQAPVTTPQDLNYLERFGDLSQMWNPMSGVQGIQNLALDAFTQDEQGNWLTNMNNPFVNTTMNTAGYGKFRSGLDAFLNPSNDIFQLGGAMRGSQQAMDTYKGIAQQLGIDPNDPDLINKVKKAASSFVSLEGMGGQDPNDPRKNTRTLYMNTGKEWMPVSSQNWTQREKGSYIQEHPGVLVPLSIVAGGLAAGAAGGASAGAAGAGGSTSLAGQIANALGMGGQFSSLPTWLQTGLSGALQGAGQSAITNGNPLQGALTGGVGGALSPVVGGAIKDLGLGSTVTGGLTGATMGGLNSLVSGSNPLTGALLGGAGGLTSGGVNALGGNAAAGSALGNVVKQGLGGYIQDQIKDEVFQGRQDLMNNVFSEAQARGISPQQLQQFMQTPQGRAAVQQLIQQQGKGTLQSLFG